MSLLWSSLIARLMPPPPGAVGIGFGRNNVMAVRTAREGETYRITHAAQEPLPISFFTNAMPRGEDCAVLTEAMQRLAISVPQSYWPLQIALPDPAAIFQIMEFDTLPDTPHERMAIAKFRLEKEFPTMTQMECTTQVISQDGERGLLLALFVQRAWLDCLKKACSAAGFVPSVIDITTSHLFNWLYGVIKDCKGSGVLVSIEPDSWSILFWDEAHRPRLVRSRWRDIVEDRNTEYAVIAQDIERLIVSYVLRLPGSRVGTIYLCANEDDRASLAARLDERMQTPCVQLKMANSFLVTPDLAMERISHGVLAAAVPRI